MCLRISEKSWLVLSLLILVGLCWNIKTTLAKPANQIVFLDKSRQYAVNGVVYRMDMFPFIRNDTFFVPAGALTHALGISDRDMGTYGNILSVCKGSMLVNNQTLLPVRCVSELMGYQTSWVAERRALLIGPPDQLPGIPPDLLPLPMKVIPVEMPKSFKTERKIAEASILFPRNKDVNNVTNAGLAAGHVNGVNLLPGEVFSFNRTVGPRTKEKGFIKGFNVWHTPVVGGGVCRMSTVLYQLAKKAGLQIIERHPHSVRVDYVPPGEDATVDYGLLDFKFKNNSSSEMGIYAALTEEKQGRLLWAHLFEYKTPPRYDVAVLRRLTDQSVWRDVEPQRLTAIGLNGVSYISLKHLGCALDWKVTVTQTGGKLKSTLVTTTQKAEFDCASREAIINGQYLELKSPPFCLTDSNCKFWLPLRELIQLLEGEVIWVPGPPGSIILNVSGISIEDRPELDLKK